MVNGCHENMLISQTNHLKFASNEALEGYFQGQKQAYKRKELGFQAKRRKACIQIAIQKIRISAIQKTGDTSDRSEFVPDCRYLLCICNLLPFTNVLIRFSSHQPLLLMVFDRPSHIFHKYLAIIHYYSPIFVDLFYAFTCGKM